MPVRTMPVQHGAAEVGNRPDVVRGHRASGANRAVQPGRQRLGVPVAVVAPFYLWDAAAGEIRAAEEPAGPAFGHDVGELTAAGQRRGTPPCEPEVPRLFWRGPGPRPPGCGQASS